MPVQADVVALMVDVIIDPYAPPEKWVHHDGQQVTADEVRMINSATQDDFGAVIDYSRRAQEHARDRMKDFERVGELLRPYGARLPDSTRMDDVMTHMSADERAELVELVDRLAPDGIPVRRTSTDGEG